MIDYRAITIGNFFLFKGDLVKTTSVLQNEIWMDIIKDNKLTVERSNTSALKPIKLTSGIVPKDLKLIQDRDTISVFNKGIEVLNMSISVGSMLEIRYLHELQNLYKALNSKDLDLARMLPF